MTKRGFIKYIIISSILAVFVVAAIIVFCIAMFDQYSMPNEDNTSIINAMVTDVYYGVSASTSETVVEMSNGDSLTLVCPWFERSLYSAIGYDIDELADLLEGKNVKCLLMNRLPWAVKIYVDDIVIDNSKLTEDQIIVTRISIVVLGLIMLAFPITGEILYIKSIYRHYKKLEKKLRRKKKRELRKS